jgi:peptidoglycan/LPS O-acetylase OafA/YrhL
MSITTQGVAVTGDDSGAPPGDRQFRPDVQGLRAIAILLALVYHADIPPFSGGYVGIEVFFVISGFVITGLLLREHEKTGHTSLRSFYGRRVRRILPMATLVIIVTIIASYVFIGATVGGQTAVDGRWAAVFLANFHYAATDTNYLVAQSPPSPLLNYWSLGVEEQFYIV